MQSNITIIPFLTKVSAYILNPLIFILFLVAGIYFALGVFKLITADPSKREEGKSNVLWGLVGMFVMISTYGIIGLILDTFDIPKTEAPFIERRL